jgi:hypothetical protein
VHEKLTTLLCVPYKIHRFTGQTATTWSIWKGGALNTDPSASPGSAYIDIAVIRMDKGAAWWHGMSNPSGVVCGSKTFRVRACGYPGDKGNGEVAYCSDGDSSLPINLCDTTRDFFVSRNIFTASGQSGGPLLDRDRGVVLGLVTGGSTSTRTGQLVATWYVCMLHHSLQN